MNRLALYTDDRIAFAATLFDAWSRGHQVVLPGDDLPATRAALTPHIDGWLTPERSAMPTLARIDRKLEGVIVFTSGSTGAPVAIKKTLRQLFDEVATLDTTFGGQLTKDTVFVSSVSHQHIYGLLFTVLWPVLTGRVMSPRRFEYPEELEQAMAHDSVLVSSPAHLKRLPDTHVWSTKARAVFSSGGPLASEASQLAKQIIGHTPIEVYGSSETGGIAWRQGSSSAWKALSGVSVRASAENTLEVKSPHLPDDAWFTTADRVELHDDSFRLLGRADRIAKIEEKRVSLDLIERTCLSTGLFSDARVVVLPGARVTVGLVAVPKDKTLTKKHLTDSIKEAVKDVVEPVARPRRFRFPETMPADERGKTPEALLTKLFAPERPDANWTERTPESATLSLTIVPELRALDGHFPKLPVVPGVAQVDWAISFAKEVFPVSGHFVRLEALKFQAIMQPGNDVNLAMSWNAAKTTLTFKFTGGTRTYSSGKVVWAP
ncbi:MAG: AMP-binding protein [Archangium sp.]